jgi:hypothetical protein
MIMKHSTLFLLSLANSIIAVHCIGQGNPRNNLQVKEFYEVKVGEPVIIKIGEICTKCNVLVSDFPDGATFDNKTLTFMWKPTTRDREYYNVSFTLNDSSDNAIDRQRAIIYIKEKYYLPELKIDNAEVVTGKVKVTEGVLKEFTMAGKNLNSNDSNDVFISYTIDNDPNIRNLEGMNVTIRNNNLFFEWTPQDAQARRKLLFFRVTAIDSKLQILNKDLEFSIKNVDQPPILISRLQSEYKLSPKKKLEVEFKVRDPDNDELVYEFVPKRLPGKPEFKEGVFSWEITNDEYLKFMSTLPMQLKLSVFQKDDTTHRIDKKISISPNSSDSPPELKQLGTFTFFEGELVNAAIEIKDEDVSSLKIKITDILNIKPSLGPVLKSRHENGNYFVLYSESILPYDFVKKDDNNRLLSIEVTDRFGNTTANSFTASIKNVDNPNLSLDKFNDLKIAGGALSGKDKELTQFLKEFKMKKNTAKNWALGVGLTASIATVISVGHDMTKTDQEKKQFPIIGASISVVSLVALAIPSLNDAKTKFMESIIENAHKREEVMTMIQIMDKNSKSPNLNEIEFAKSVDDLEKLINTDLNDQKFDIDKMRDFKHMWNKYQKYTSSLASKSPPPMTPKNTPVNTAIGLEKK